MQFSRANDRVGLASLTVRPAVEELEGTWFNVDPETGEIGRIVISVQEGVVSLEVWALDAGQLIPWGKRDATPYVERIGSALVTGFLSDHELGFARTRLAANLKHGVLVIQSYTEFCDGSGRPAYFTREFFSREVLHRPASRPPAAEGSSGGSIALGHYVGAWTNTNPHTHGITHFTFEVDGGRYRIRAFGADDPGEWGCAEVIPYVDSVSGVHGRAFMARYDLGVSEVTLAANENKGLIIIAAYHRFPEGSARPSYYVREFFYRQEVVRR